MSFQDPRFWANRAFDRHDERFEKQTASAIESGTQALRATFLLNGGACVALLGFLASTFTAAGLDQNAIALRERILEALVFFALGAFCAVLTSGLAYVINSAYAESLSRSELHFEHPYTRDTTSSRRWERFAVILNFIAVGVVVLSLLLFLCGLLRVQGLF